jgi:hypothetical protein
VASVAALRPHHDHQTAAQVADGDHAGLAVIPSVVDAVQRYAFKDLGGVLE